MAITLNGTTGISGVDGSAGTPALQGTDTNTGIFFGTDEVSIATGGSNRLIVDSSGRVGLGTSSPSTNIEINAALDTGASLGLNEGQLSVGREANSGGAVRIGYDTTNNFGFISSGRVGTSWDKLILNAGGGNVGIGSNSPSTALEVKADYVGGTGQLRVNGNSGQRYTGISLANNGTGKLLVYHDNTDDIVRIDAQSATGSLSFGSNGEAFRVDSSKRLLVGTSSASDGPIYAVDTGAGRDIAGELSGTNALGFRFVTYKARGSTSSKTIVSNGDELGSIVFQGYDGAAFRIGASIVAAVDNVPGASDMPSRIAINTTADGASSPTERVTINAVGDVQFRNSAGVYPITDNAVPLGKSGLRWSAVWAANGTIQTSDERAKTEITESRLGSDFVKSLRPVSYKWIEGGKRHTGQYDAQNNCIYESIPGERLHWGFIAQEVKQVVDAAGVDFGGWVLTDKDDPDSYQALRYDQFIAPLTKALQETMAELEALKAEVAALKAS